MNNKENRSKDENFLLIGRNPIFEAIEAGKEIEKIFVNAALRGEVEKELRKLSKDYNIPLVKVPLDRLNIISNHKNHQGIVAYTSPIKFQQLAEVIPHIYDQGLVPNIVILESVSDVRNMAAIARSALTMGAHALVITAKNSARINEEAVKISAGAILDLPICREKNMIEVLSILGANGIKVYATDLKGATSLPEADFTLPMAFVLGDEHLGVTPETLKMADEKIKIPQPSEFDSLNVSVAAGIIMYEIVRQRTLV
jgi:23S rRNA (guanosine2251-2'-O)-methyltransferase